MAQTTSNVNTTSETFNNWVTKTNELRYALQTVIVTANSTLGNTAGNCHINGFLAGNTLVACANIAGGSIAANGSGTPQISFANLVHVTNCNFTANLFVSTGVRATDNGIWTHANTHVFNSNVTANGSHFIISSTTRLFANGSAGTDGQVLTSNGTTVYWASVGNPLDSVTNTSITLAAAANSVKTAYDAAVNPTVSFARTYSANLSVTGTRFIIGTSTAVQANGSIGTAGQVLTSNGTTVYWSTVSAGGGTTVLDSVSNTSTTIAAAANSVKTAYDAAIVANTNAQTADTKALAANTRAASAQTAASTADTNAINANTRAASAQTAAVAAYSNAIAWSANASKLTSGTVATARMHDSVVRHVSSGYTGSARLFVSSSTPGSPVKGDIWFEI